MKSHDPKGPKEGAKKQQAKERQAAFTERQRIAGLVKWQKWVTPTEAEELDALLSQLRSGQAPNVKPERTRAHLARGPL